MSTVARIKSNFFSLYSGNVYIELTNQDMGIKKLAHVTEKQL